MDIQSSTNGSIYKRKTALGKKIKKSVVKAMKRLCNYAWHEAAFKN